jgi:uncharacterized protein DUF6265
MIELRLAAMSAFVCFVASSAPAAEPCSLAALGWMAGNWVNATDPAHAQERWVVAPGSVLMGGAWELPAGKAGFAEIMTIRPDGASVSMFLRHFGGDLAHAKEDRDAPMVFSLSKCAAASATFDGQGGNAGEHMTYTRNGDAMLIAADFLHSGAPLHVEWRMVRKGD